MPKEGGGKRAEWNPPLRQDAQFAVGTGVLDGPFPEYGRNKIRPCGQAVRGKATPHLQFFNRLF